MTNVVVNLVPPCVAGGRESFLCSKSEFLVRVFFLQIAVYVCAMWNLEKTDPLK